MIQEDAIAWLVQQTEKWRRISERDTWNASAADIKRLTKGHGMWDDPPEGYTEERLLDWFRGYLYAEETHCANAAEAVRFALLQIEPPDKNFKAKMDRRLRFWLRDYGLLLQQELDEFTSGSGTRHTVAIDATPSLTIVTVQFLHDDPFANKMPGFVEEKIREGYQALRAAEGSGIVLLKIAEKEVDNRPCGITVEMDAPVVIIHPSLPHYWSNVQAWQDSNEIIAKILTLHPASP